ncbi:(2Fe-2S)-binding protein [Clostridium cellulovorans]|uniref:BFD domain protein (2Fe-2S)-binding domain protein n=1 Tax=Clostridium cellulovorans (strain ATCC 35296 / DSM 3052 / OCM 3 / 743B) TaxID=573061 RepID=D9SMP8_CLOC7|nr:(2Fe-2S)-binding protein [Clostridium cellulovorans]ADL49833.1 BFD domain protein (2Fe-2S)-binding domain protein [Clostridium cellulovorans 743B]
MDQNIKPEILDKLTKICLCKSISRATIKAAIIKGAKTIEEVNKATGAGTGGCQGRRCGPKIQELLEAHENGEF